jgi:hypothetical protein
MCETDDKNQTKNQLMSSQAFHRTPYGCAQETTIWERFELGILVLFDPVAQELYRLLPTTIHHETNNESKNSNTGAVALWTEEHDQETRMAQMGQRAGSQTPEQQESNRRWGWWLRGEQNQHNTENWQPEKLQARDQQRTNRGRVGLLHRLDWRPNTRARLQRNANWGDNAFHRDWSPTLLRSQARKWVMRTDRDRDTKQSDDRNVDQRNEQGKMNPAEETSSRRCWLRQNKKGYTEIKIPAQATLKQDQTRSVMTAETEGWKQDLGSRSRKST